MGMESSQPPTTPVMALVPPGPVVTQTAAIFIVDPGVAFRRNGTRLLMVVKGAVEARLMAQAVVQMHGPASGDHEYIRNPLIHQLPCNVVGNFHSHKNVYSSPAHCACT